MFFAHALVVCADRDDGCERGFEDAGAQEGEHCLDVVEGLVDAEDHEDEVEAHEAPEADHVFDFAHAATGDEVQDLEAVVGADLLFELGGRLALVARDGVDVGGDLGERDNFVDQMGGSRCGTDNEYMFHEVDEQF